MNSLEFIEKEIKQLEERKEKAFKNEYYSVYKECSQKITTLQQIKAKLEAWEVVKDKQVDIFYINICKDANVYNEYKPRLKNLTNEEWDKIKKALEVINNA